MSKIIIRYLQFIDELYHIIDKSKLDKEELRQINLKYKNFKIEYGAEIKKILYITRTRTEDHPHIYENADFSLETINDLIKQGEAKTNEALLI